MLAITHRTRGVHRAIEALMAMVEDGYDPVDAAGILAGTMIEAATNDGIRRRLLAAATPTPGGDDARE